MYMALLHLDFCFILICAILNLQVTIYMVSCRYMLYYPYLHNPESWRDQVPVLCSYLNNPEPAIGRCLPYSHLFNIEPSGLDVSGIPYRHLHIPIVARPTLGRLNPGKSPQYSFYRRPIGPQDQSGQEGAKKNIHLPTPGIEPRLSSP